MMSGALHEGIGKSAGEWHFTLGENLSTVVPVTDRDNVIEESMKPPKNAKIRLTNLEPEVQF